MPMFIFENVETREIASIDAVNEPKARLDLGDKWHLARLVPHANAQRLFDETVADEKTANLNSEPAAKQLKARREVLAHVVARLMAAK